MLANPTKSLTHNHGFTRLFAAWLALSLALLLLLVGASQVAAVARQADTPEVATVEPATNLTDGQVVVFTMTQPENWQEIVFLQCLAGTDDCQQLAVNGFYADGQQVKGGVVVWRMIDVVPAGIDCALQSCVLRAFHVQYSNTGQTVSGLLAEGGLAFDPAVPEKPRPTTSVTPAAGLNDEDLVTLTGEGFGPFDQLSIRQCAVESARIIGHNPLCRHYADDAAEADGTFSTDLRVLRRISSPSVAGGIDCAVVDCYVSVEVQNNNHYRAPQRNDRGPIPIFLNFENSPIERPQPVVRTKPRNNLVDGQEVTVSVERHPDVYGSEIVQCEAGETDLSRCMRARTVRVTGEDSTDHYTVIVRRILRFGDIGHGGVPIDGTAEPIDCAADEKRCALFVVLYGQVFDMAESARGLTFDPDVPSSRATVVIAGRNKIAPDEQTSIAVSNNTNIWIQVRQCPRTATNHEEQGCIQIGQSSHRQARNLTIMATPTRYLDMGRDVPALDCVQPKACDFRVYGSDGPIRRLLVNFVGEQAEPPSFTVDSQRDLVHGQELEATITASNQVWSVSQCVVGEANVGHESCIRTGATNVGSRRVPPELSPNPVDAKVRVSRFVRAFDCSLEPRSCEFQLEVRGVAVARRSIIFTAAAVHPSGVLEAKPRRNLVGGQPVRVTVRGSVPTYLNIFQCLSETTELGFGNDTCVLVGSARQRADLKATASANIGVRRFIGENDCAERAGRCVLRAVTSGSTFEAEFVNLRFDADAEELAGPTYTVRPKRNLTHGQTVLVGSPDIESAFVQVSQCGVIDGQAAEGSCSELGWFEAQPSSINDAGAVVNAEAPSFEGVGPEFAVTMNEGVAQAEVVVQRFVSARWVEAPWDCANARNACILRFTVFPYSAGTPKIHEAGVSFDPEGPDPTDISVSVRPRRQLADNQKVQIELSDTFPGTASFQQCLRSESGDVVEDSCSHLGSFTIRAGESSGTIEVGVPRYLYSENDNLDSEQDCASIAPSCVIRIQHRVRSGNHGIAFDVQKNVSISFDADKPAVPLAPIGLTVSPEGPFGEATIVTVAGPAPSEQEATVIVVQCEKVGRGVASIRCEGGHQSLSALGAWSVEMQIFRFASSEGCMKYECFLVAFADRPGGFEAFSRSETLAFE